MGDINRLGVERQRVGAQARHGLEAAGAGRVNFQRRSRPFWAVIFVLFKTERQNSKLALIRPVGHLLPFVRPREKAIILRSPSPVSDSEWEKVADRPDEDALSLALSQWLSGGAEFQLRRRKIHLIWQRSRS